MKIAVVGTGYVGLVSGACFAETGNQVTCVDIDASKVELLQNGGVPIYEPKLDILLERNIKQNRIHFTTDLAAAIEDAEIVFLALPTPPGEDGSADLSYVLGVAKQIGLLIKDYKVIVNKSTVPVGTAEKVRAVISQYADADTEFDVLSNPEFLREGVAIDDFMKPDRVVVGTASERAEKIMRRLYAPFVRQGNPIYCMDIRSAELTKYAANSYLATRISFMNEIANICEKVGANVNKVRMGMGSDSRIGKRFLFAGVGYGGSCFPKDVLALATTAKQYGYNFNILDSVIQVNANQRVIMMQKIKDYFNNNFEGKKIAVWGLAFKPDTDDIREAPAIHIISELLAGGAEVTTFDPEAMDNVAKVFGDRVQFCENAYDALPDADALVIVTEWNVFRTPDFAKMEKLLKNKVIFDGRNIYGLENMEQLGFYYNSIGRAVINENVAVNS